MTNLAELLEQQHKRQHQRILENSIFGAGGVSIRQKQDNRYAYRYTFKAHQVDEYEVAQEVDREHPVAFASVSDPNDLTAVFVHDSLVQKFLGSEIYADDVPVFWDAFANGDEEPIDGTNVMLFWIMPEQEAEFRDDVKQIVSARWQDVYPLEEVEVRVMRV